MIFLIRKVIYVLSGKRYKERKARRIAQDAAERKLADEQLQSEHLRTQQQLAKEHDAEKQAAKRREALELTRQEELTHELIELEARRKSKVEEEAAEQRRLGNPFEIGGRYKNRKGFFTVVGLTKTEVHLRWDSGQELVDTIESQQHILRNMPRGEAWGEEVLPAQATEVSEPCIRNSRDNERDMPSNKWQEPRLSAQKSEHEYSDISHILRDDIYRPPALNPFRRLRWSRGSKILEVVNPDRKPFSRLNADEIQALIDLGWLELHFSVEIFAENSVLKLSVVLEHMNTPLSEIEPIKEFELCPTSRRYGFPPSTWRRSSSQSNAKPIPAYCARCEKRGIKRWVEWPTYHKNLPYGSYCITKVR